MSYNESEVDSPATATDRLHNGTSPHNLPLAPRDLPAATHLGVDIDAPGSKRRAT